MIYWGLACYLSEMASVAAEEVLVDLVPLSSRFQSAKKLCSLMQILEIQLSPECPAYLAF